MDRPATSYAAPGERGGVPVLLQPLFTRVRQALQQHGVTLHTDRRLHRAAKTLLAARSLDRLGSAGLQFALQGHGVVEPHARLLADEVEGVGQIHRAFFARVVAAASAGQLNRLGGAVRVGPDQKLQVVVVLVRSYLRLEPVVRQPRASTSVLMRGALAPGFSSPRAVITRPGGVTRRARLTAATDGTFHVVVPLSAGRGVYQLEILGSGPRGPEVLANFPLYVGLPSPTRYVLRPPPRRRAGPLPDGPAVERQLISLVNRARRRAGRSALQRDAVLARVARAHAVEMCRREDVRHFSPSTGTAVDRVRKAGLKAQWVGENVGRGQTVAQLHREFLRSPAHRAALLRQGLTHLGVGVCINRSTTGERTLYVTELFVRRR